MNEINQLRKETKQLRNKIGALETELENARRGKKHGPTLLSGGPNQGNQIRRGGRASTLEGESSADHSNVGAALRQLSASSRSSVPSQPENGDIYSEDARSISRSRMRPSTAGTVIARNRSYSSTTMLRPKSGGRPLTAAQRRRRMPRGPSLSRSMQVLRSNQSEQQLERLREQNSRLVSQNMSLSRRLMKMSASVPMRESKPASGEKQKGKASPPSSAILSGYTKSTEQIRAGDDNHQISSVQNMFPKSGTRPISNCLHW